MKVIFLCGLPGSGKTTIAKKHFKNYIHINQDELGSREKCYDVMSTALMKKQNVIIDRVFSTVKERKFWLDLVSEYHVDTVTCIYLDVPEEECIARVYERKNHETIKEDFSIETIRNMVYTFNRDFEEITLGEGFSTIVITRN